MLQCPVIVKSGKREPKVSRNGLIEELKKTWEVNALMLPVVTVALGAVNSQAGTVAPTNPSMTPATSVQKSAIQGTAKILHKTLRLPGLW